MTTKFRISGLPAEQFQALFEMSDDALTQIGAKRYTADAKPGYPCRVSLQDAELGESLILLPFVHHDANSPYRASGPIFVREGALQAWPDINEVPDAVRQRLLSVRAYDANGYLLDADVAEGQQLEASISKFFSDAQISYLHLHNARPGCYSCRVDRAAPAMAGVELTPAF